MKIIAITPVVVNAQMRNWVFVKVQTDDGITGWGEASVEWKTRGVVGCIEDLAPFVLGEDPTRDIQALTDARALQEHHFSVQPRKSAMMTPGPAGLPPRGAAVLPPP